MSRIDRWETNVWTGLVTWKYEEDDSSDHASDDDERQSQWILEEKGTWANGFGANILRFNWAYQDKQLFVLTDSGGNSHQGQKYDADADDDQESAQVDGQIENVLDILRRGQARLQVNEPCATDDETDSSDLEMKQVDWSVSWPKVSSGWRIKQLLLQRPESSRPQGCR